jgi:hypothetical protein
MADDVKSEDVMRSRASLLAEAATALGKSTSWLLDQAAEGSVEVCVSARIANPYWQRKLTKADAVEGRFLERLIIHDQHAVDLAVHRAGNMVALPPGPRPELRQLTKNGVEMPYAELYAPRVVDPLREIFTLAAPPVLVALDSLWLYSEEIERVRGLMGVEPGGEAATRSDGSRARASTSSARRAKARRELDHGQRVLLAECVDLLSTDPDAWHLDGEINGYYLEKQTGRRARGFLRDKPIGRELDRQRDALWLKCFKTPRPGSG